MQYIIPADVIARHRQLNPDISILSVKDNSVRLVTTNEKIMVVELIGHSSETFDIGVKFPLDCDYTLTVFSAMNMVTWGTASIAVPIPERWRQWQLIPLRADTSVKQQHGFLYLDLATITLLVNIAPSNEIVLPSKFDTRMPITVNDVHVETWTAFFHPRDENYSNGLKPAMSKGWAM